MSRRASLALLSLLLVVALPREASGAKHKKKGPASTPPAAAQRAVVDPRTGELVNGPLPHTAPQPAPPAAPPEFVVEQMPGGGVKVTLDDRAMAATVARIDDKGKLTLHCVTAPHAHPH